MKYLKILFVLAFVFLIGFPFFVLYQQLPHRVYKLNNPPRLITQSVPAGGLLQWQNDVCKLHNSPFYSQRTLVNLDTGREYLFSDIGTKGTLNKGECRVSIISQLIPDNQPQGRYELKTQVFVKTNRWTTDKFEYSVGPFEVKGVIK